MTNCEYCNYFRSVDEGNVREMKKTAICVFADTVLYTDFEKSDMEYPCKDISYQEYLNRNKYPDSASKAKVTDMKFIYRSIHPVAERKRSKVAG